MSTIDRLLKQLCPDGVEYRKLGDIGTFVRGNGIQKKDFTTEGIGCIHYGQLYTHYGIWTTKTKSFISANLACGKKLAHKGDLVIATTSENEEDVCKAVAWLGEDDIAISGDAYIYRHEQNPKYVAYFFQSVSFQKAKRQFITGTKVLRLSGDSMAKIIMPIPPMEIQEEIVNILDNFAELEAELEARRKQYAYYRDQLLAFDERERE